MGQRALRSALVQVLQLLQSFREIGLVAFDESHLDPGTSSTVHTPQTFMLVCKRRLLAVKVFACCFSLFWI
eukprot:COSAG05_NODE_276_length_12393_cov_1737.505694_14_plen_71_part_00